MTRRLAAILASLLLLAASALAQGDEADFSAKQAEKLNAFAKRAFTKGFPRQARVIWLQVLKLYDPDNTDANTALGYKKLGTSWNPDPSFTYPTTDSGTGAEGTALFKAYEGLKKDLGNAHRMQAKKWADAGRTDKAQYHYKMTLRWIDGDKEAQAALEYREIGTLSGTALEQTLYERSKLIEKAVNEQSKTDYAVEQVQVESQPLLAAQVKYVSMKSENFLIHGDPGQEEQLAEAARWAERTLRVCQQAFPWADERTGPKKNWSTEWGFFLAKETYHQILKANADKIPDLQFALENSSTIGMGSMIVGATGSEKVLYDAAVRNTAKGVAGFGTTGLGEGIGHTFVGMMFNNNRLFAVDRKRQEGTTASEEDREFTSPDFDVWKTLNLELAWKSTGGVPARDIPFCDAANFTNEQRIKAWSFCDYVMRRDPEILRKMDQLGLQMLGQRRKNPMEFEQKFDEANEVKVAELDRGWEDFWTESSSVLKAIQNNTAPLAAVSKGVEKWLEAFNAARKEYGGSPVTWSSNLSTRCADHANYLKANKAERGPAKEHTQSIDLGGTHLGSMFAEMAIVVTDAKLANAKKLFQSWLDIPGYRDALVHDFLLTVGIYSDGDILVMNVVSGLGTPRSRNSGYTSYPVRSAQGIPTQVTVADMGPELQELLEKHGHGTKKVVGYPLTLHFGQNLQGNRATYACKVTARGKDVPGLLMLDGGNNRRTSAPGMATFWPLDPLPAGDIEVVWTWEQDNGPQRLVAPFKTK